MYKFSLTLACLRRFPCVQEIHTVGQITVGARLFRRGEKNGCLSGNYYGARGSALVDCILNIAEAVLGTVRRPSSDTQN